MRKISKIEPTLPVVPKRKRVAAYARVSMETDRLMHSLSAQISYYSDLIQKNPEWEYAGVYADSFISGTDTKKRTEFQRLLTDCDAGLIDIVLCKSISRFARNTVDLLSTIRHLKELGIEVRFEKENINSLSSDGELLLTVLASFAEQESRSISENCKWAIRKRYEKGVPRNSILYGYKVVNGQLQIEPEQAEIIKQIFEMYLNGDSCYMIACKLNETGIKSYYGKQWNGGVISYILRQEKYTGNSLMQKFFTNNFSEKKNRGELPMYYIENTHPAIISQETFDRVQQETSKRYGVEIINGIAESCSEMYHHKRSTPNGYMKRKAQWSEEQRKRHAEIYKSRETMKFLHYDFSLFIKCEVCGQNLTAQVRKFADGTKEIRWVCTKHRKLSPDGVKPPHIRDAELQNMVAEVLDLTEFNAETMCQKLKYISAYGDMLTFHFHDGHSETRKYIPPKRQYRRSNDGKNNENSCKNQPSDISTD